MPSYGTSRTRGKGGAAVNEVATTRADHSETLLGAWLLALAGFVDAVAIVVLHGSFVAFMSGNTTILGSSAATGKWQLAGLYALLIALFFGGNVAGAALVRYTGRAAHRLVMASVTAVILAGTLVATTVSEQAGLVTIGVAAGLINSALAQQTDVHVGLTYVTGTLVKAAHQLVDGIGSDRPWAWTGPLGFWAVFAVGAAAGGVAYSWLGTPALWIATGLAGITCLLPHRADPVSGPPGRPALRRQR